MSSKIPTPNSPGERNTQLLTSTQVALHLGVSTRQVTRMVQRGELPALRIGPRTLRFVLVEVVDALRREGGPALRPPAPPPSPPPPPVVSPLPPAHWPAPTRRAPARR
jgi:excisionase family DNA binding protein